MVLNPTLWSYIMVLLVAILLAFVATVLMAHVNKTLGVFTAGVMIGAIIVAGNFGALN